MSPWRVPRAGVTWRDDGDAARARAHRPCTLELKHGALALDALEHEQLNAQRVRRIH